MQQIERDCFSVAKSRSICIYTTLTFLALLGAPYIYDISRLRVKAQIGYEMSGIQLYVDIRQNYDGSGISCTHVQQFTSGEIT